MEELAMLRVLCGLAFVFALHNLLFAGDPQPSTPPTKSRRAAWSPLRATPASVTVPAEIGTAPKGNLQGRKKLEALLQASANLNYDGREKITVKAVLDDLHRQHHLSIRFDKPTLTSLFGGAQTATLASETEPAPVVNAEQPSFSGALYTADPARRATPLFTDATDQKLPAQTTDKPASEVSTKEPAVAAETKPVAAGKIEPAAGEIVDAAEVTEENSLEDLLETEVNIERIDLKNVTIATILRLALDALPVAEAMSEEGSGMPIKMTHAANFDYIIEDDGLLITTRLNALTVKETRVYSLRNLKDISPDQLAKVVRQSIRPWSWRSQINDLGDQLKSGLPQQLPAEITSLMSSGLQFASLASGFSTPAYCADGECQPLQLSSPAIADQPAGGSVPASANINGAPAAPPHGTLSIEGKISSDPQIMPPVTTTLQPDAAATTMALSTLVNALEVVAHAAISGLEMMHHADPPTGTIQTLPGKLIITQSQAAHREIADLMKQLEDE
jgi:hypothetical protein